MKIMLLAAAILGLGAGQVLALDGDGHHATTLFTSVPGAEPTAEQSVAGHQMAVTSLRRQEVAAAIQARQAASERRKLVWSDVPRQGCLTMEACLNWAK